MNTCPYCAAEYIPGEDVCEECGQPLTDVFSAPLRSQVEEGLIRDRVHSLNPKSPLAVDPTTPIRDVLKKMVEKGIGCVIVAEGGQTGQVGKVVGIFSERDALRRIGTRISELSSRPVSDFMTRGPQTLDGSAKIAFAVQRMDLGGYRHLPIVGESGQVVGIISVRDILRYLTEKMAV